MYLNLTATQSASGERLRRAPPGSASGERLSASGERLSASGERLSASGERLSASGERLSASGERTQSRTDGFYSIQS
ncbi:Mediator of RNA polymerase II transcription subunit 18 [Dissostichus eleginoides]|uniref:Mediator of RNA polymerase II transcription subunit 18 n=1 Tax=Dissostichus eleginoides TaxID=100907 RepID=A0AAD9FHT6_DISEL|nr:Mediator of RNA polymerase II transcription subunit 18 [Dissostichus eleginoides]